MGCCCSQGRDTSVTPIESDGDGELREDLDNGPLKDRSCTDIFCLVFLVAFIGGMGFVAHEGFVHGDWYRLVYGVDSWGNTCNRANHPIDGAPYSGVNLAGLSNIFYYSPADMILPGAPKSHKICVSHCPNASLLSVGDMQDWYAMTGTRLCRYDIQPAYYSNGTSSDDVCPTLPYDATLTVLNRCVPETLFDAGHMVLQQALDAVEGQVNLTALVQSQCATNAVFTTVVNDIQATWREILYTSAIAIGIAFLVTLLMGVIASIMIWLMVVITALGSLGASGYCWWRWYMNNSLLNGLAEGGARDGQEKVVHQWLIIACLASCVTVIVWLLLLVMRSRIKLVVQLFREAARAVRKMPCMLLQPVWSLLALVGICGSLLFIFMWIYSAGSPQIDEGGNVRFVAENWFWYMRWYYLLGWLWLIQLVYACEQLVIAGAVASWYFTRDKTRLGCPLLSATYRLVRYHLGTVAFGAFIVAAVQLARAILAYIQRQLAGKETKPVKFILRCLKCCFWCFEKILKFINKNAYIMVAIYGCNFCTGAKKALQQIVANVLRVGAINSIGTFCLFVCKLGVAVIAAFVGLELFFKRNLDVCFLPVPMLISALSALFIGHCFLSVYGMAIDAIFLCFCEDCGRNDGVQKPYYMNVGLMAFVENSREAILAHNARNSKR